ncbi:MAG: hypothetical protein J0I84_16030 [Terrimonas sp.]|uniref:hypothetical protein n=1 Tax=Terrimonas sp. TaxID=1914338 RepID=UPI0009275A99|nr:hypothetical protein [Terrimonas sp.]MBN8788598.1 hypothetical protein [Terrimonas sp.]OJY95831.1 MAG: hypothetical protein BGP13_00615 [Sphingobacteriales bacterium 40-81]PVD51271.1 hypothetical protein DC498_15430 [Terrimonas sp.]
MKKDEIPQDPGALGKIAKELSYVVDENGNYTTGFSTGWEIKMKALDVAWENVEKRIAEAKQKVLNGEASPLLYYMELKLMDVEIVAGYTGFWKWQVKKHLKPEVFKKLPDRKLEKYAKLFEISKEQLSQVS